MSNYQKEEYKRYKEKKKIITKPFRFEKGQLAELADRIRKREEILPEGWIYR